MKALVAYASMHGATAEIAQAIGEELRQTGVETEVRAVDDVRDIRAFDAVVLGSGVYNGKWRKEALRFGERHAVELRTRRVWFFESGPTDTSADEGRAVPTKGSAQLASEVGAQQHVIFGGQFGPEDVGGFTGRLIAMGGESAYGDFRNFDRIRAWARGIGTELQAAQPVAAP